MKAAVALISLLVFAGCASLERRTAGAFIGNWLYADEVQSCRYSFKPDGSFSGDVKYQGKTISSFTGQWHVNQEGLFYTYLSDVFARIPPGARDRDRVLEVRRDSFMIEAANGERRRYRRVRERRADSGKACLIRGVRR